VTVPGSITAAHATRAAAHAYWSAVRLVATVSGFGILLRMPIAPGNRLRCSQCETEIIVVKGSDGEVSCCGQPMAPREG
jgi:hypothetical protein